MAMGVIDVLEVIDIQDQQRQGLTIAPGAGEVALGILFPVEIPCGSVVDFSPRLDIGAVYFREDILGAKSHRNTA
jgi:hypothetical protein